MARQEPGEPYWRISVDEAKNMLEDGESIVIDVRQPDEWASGHVQGAVHIPVDDVLVRIDELPVDKNLLFSRSLRRKHGGKSLGCKLTCKV